MTIPSNWRAQPLTAGEKVHAGVKDLYSYENFAAMFISAGYEQILNSSPNYGTDKGAFGERLGAAAIRVSMVSLGLLQYLAPTLQFALGILVFHEEMPASRWIGFALVWVALAVFTVEALHHRRRQLQLIARASAA